MHAVPLPDTTYRRRWWTLATLCLSLVLIVMDNTILNVALPSLVRDLGASNSQLQWIVDAYVLVFAGLLLTAGTIGDRFGRRGALTGGLVLFGIGSAGALLVETAGQLIGVRAFLGIGGALIMPATLSILTDVFRDPKERGRAIAIWAGTSGLGVAIGPVVGGLLLQHYSWHSVFLLNVPVVAVALLAGRFFVPSSKDAHAPRLDLPGAVLSITGLVSMVWAIIEAPRHGWTAPTVLAGFAVAVVALGAFVAWELHTDHPMLDIRFFEDRRFTAANGAITLTFFAMFGSMFLMTQYMQFVMGYSPLQAGVRMLPWAAAMMVVAPASARIVESVGTKNVVSAGLSVVALGLFAMSTIEADTTYGPLVLRMMVLAVGLGLVMAPATEAVMGSLPPAKAGVGSAVNDTTREVGGALGVAVIGSIVTSAYSGRIGDRLANLPASALTAAKESLGGALAVAQQLPTGGAEVARTAQVAFVEALSRGLVLGGIVAAVAAVLTYAFLPARATEKLHAQPDRPVDDLVGADA